MGRAGKAWGWAGLAACLLVAIPLAAQKPDPNEEAAQKAFMADLGRPPVWHLTQIKRMNAAIAALKPQRPGVVDAYVVSIGLDSDPVFGREAAEAAKVLSRRYDAEGRTLLLAAGGGAGPVPNGSAANLQAALAAVAGLMDPKEDVLVLYTTSHGAPKVGIVYKDGDNGSGFVAPKSLAGMMEGLGIRNRLVMISACYSGIFIPALANDDTVLVTAASPVTTSFGCASGNDWTFFGDALLNHALRKSQPLAAAFGEARGLVGAWEARGKLIPSNPQIAVGPQAAAWLRPIEARMPKDASAPVGRPATEAMDQAVAANH